MTQTSFGAASAVEYLPASQCTQAAGPDTALYLPAGHRTHQPSIGPVQPATQAHSPLPAGASAFCLQGTQLVWYHDE